jgi:hypothetical protein
MPKTLYGWQQFDRLYFILIIYIELVFVDGAQPRKTHPIELTIKSGSIRGEYLTIGANDFAVFKGIPYAAPPVGSLRFAFFRGYSNFTR